MNFMTKLLQGIAFVPALVQAVEALFGSKPGGEKKEAALSFVQAAISMTDAVANREIVEADRFKEGLGKIIDGTVECLNASTWAKR
jgi:hypothetical protein